MIELTGYVPVFVMNPASLLNQERLTDDDAIELAFPADPMYAKPCESDGKYTDDPNVDDAVVKIPEKPSTDEVELPYDCEVNGNTCAARVDVATEETTPLDPMNEYPCERDER